MLVKIRRASDIKQSEITSQSDYLKRRQFLKAGVSAFAGLGLMRAGIGEAAIQRGPGKLEKIANIRETAYRPPEAITEYEHITTYNNFYEFGTGKDDPFRNAQDFEPRPWSITVDGHAGKTGTFDFDDFIKPFDLEERIYRMRCVEAWSMVIPWVGISLADIVKHHQPTSKAKYVAFETLFDPKRMPGQRRRVLGRPGLAHRDQEPDRPPPASRRCPCAPARATGWECPGSTVPGAGTRTDRVPA